MRRGLWIAGVAGLFVIMVGCGGGNESDRDLGLDVSGDVDIDVAVDSQVADGETTERDVVQDQISTDLQVDVVEDTDVSADATPGPLDVPYVTPPCLNPYVDNPFVQEINHTGIEIDPEITDVYDVVIRPDWAPQWFDNPTTRPRLVFQAFIGMPMASSSRTIRRKFLAFRWGLRLARQDFT